MSNQIKGWKSIGGYFGRDRTTAIRWARERGLPVRRMPGGKRATVYALKDELDAWIAGNEPDAVIDTSTREPDPPVSRGLSRRLMIGGGVIGVLTVGVTGMFAFAVRKPTDGAQPDLPDDPDLAQIYLRAREDWARRTPTSLDRAVVEFQAVTRRAPDFAPGHAGLAEALLLSREFGTMADNVAFPRAIAAADAALALDPRMASAHRARGFILYWWDHDARASGRAMRQARTLSPRDAQTRFWYGNILADNGQDVPAMREFDAARLLEPGSVAIQTDRAWAIWCAGRDEEARTLLQSLSARYPDYSVIPDCLSTMRLAEGDYAGYAMFLATFARLKDDADLLRHATELERRLPIDLSSVQTLMLDRALSEVADNPRRNRHWAAFVASVADDRTNLLAILNAAERRSERWGAAGLMRRMLARAEGDAEITGLLTRRKSPPVE